MYCKTGLWCNITDWVAPAGTCTPQVKAGSACTNDYMCPNSQGCLNNTCTDYYSQALTTNVSLVAGNSTPSQFCLSMEANEVNKTCTGLSYNTATFPNMSKTDSNGLVTCSVDPTANNTLCMYNDIYNNPFTEDCQCSYDSQGRSFCRKAYTESDANWKKLASAARSKIGSSSCHTMNRFTCWDTPTNARTDTYDASLVTNKAAQFVYADKCIKLLFNSGEFIRFSFVILAALLISLI